MQTVQMRISLGALAIAGMALGACGDASGDSESPLPAEIHGMELQATHVGDQAAAILESLHGTAVGSDRNWVGVYGSMEMAAALYVSRYPTPAAAQAEFDSMVEGIEAGTAPFGHHAWFTRAGQRVHSAFGQGQVNYFWVRDADVWWLGVHPLVARMAAAELLSLPPDSIPALGLPTLPPEAESP